MNFKCSACFRIRLSPLIAVQREGLTPSITSVPADVVCLTLTVCKCASLTQSNSCSAETGQRQRNIKLKVISKSHFLPLLCRPQSPQFCPKTFWESCWPCAPVSVLAAFLWWAKRFSCRHFAQSISKVIEYSGMKGIIHTHGYSPFSLHTISGKLQECNASRHFMVR